ncbi:MAG: DUF4249 domain-containing protein [Spirosomataceae bacterium]
MKKIGYILLLAVISWACVERYDVPLRNEKAILVVEGQINSNKPPYYVRLSYTGLFDYGNTIPPENQENGAKVVIIEEGGATATLYSVGGGLYATQTTSLRGQVGRSYSLKVQLPDGTIYVSKPEKLSAAPPIDQITYKFADIPNEYNLANDPISPDGFRIYIDFKDPANVTNYYRWTAYGLSRRTSTGVRCPYTCGDPKGCWCNTSCYVRKDDNSVNLLSDALIDGQTIKGQYVYFAPLYATGLQTIEVAQYSLTREAYQFLKKYQEQQSRTGSLFDPVPAPLEGNVYNEANPSQLALGYFSAAGVYRKRYVFDPGSTDLDLILKLPPRRYNPNNGDYDFYNTLGPCTEKYKGAFGLGEWPPAGWATEDLNN